MKITFDYNNVTPNEIAKTIEHFYNTYSDLTLKKGNGEQHTWNKYVEKELTFKAGFPSMYVYEPTRERMGLRKYRNGKWSSVTKLYSNSI